MKIRSNYVSNSSSSSFIIFGNNAKRFCDSIEDGKPINKLGVANYVWYEFIRDIFNEYQEIKFVSDTRWKNDFPHGNNCMGKLPVSIKDDNKFSINDYKDVFMKWFVVNYSRNTFYEIEFSDHPDETKYNEEEMDVFVYDYSHNYDDKYFTINNH